jgi:hypothetical protein
MPSTCCWQSLACQGISFHELSNVFSCGQITRGDDGETKDGDPFYLRGALVHPPSERLTPQAGC